MTTSLLESVSRREERWEYPLDAVRKIVINAIVHRDYSSASDSITKVYDDCIEIFNPGRLPEGLSMERLLSESYVSSIRNRKIADMFKEAGFIEKCGTGSRRILQGFAEHGLPAPESIGDQRHRSK
jgi:ATP-dependent DNA helicase RecG